MKFGSITTGIIADGLVFNIDAANRASTIPSTSTTTTFNTVDTSTSGSFSSTGMFDTSNQRTFAFDGSNNINVNFTNTNPKGSISVWINPTDYTTGQQVVFCFNGSGYRDYIGVFQLSSGVIGFETADNGTNKWRVITTSSTVNNGAWTHLFCTFNGSNAVIYVDGVAVSQSYTHTSDITYWWNDLTPTNLRLGILLVSGYSTSQYYNGNIGPVQIYNRALSSSEVLHNYNALKGRFE